MASQTRPFLMTGAALASAAALVVATPAIAPKIAASPLSVSNSGVNLATFADVFTIPSEEWTASYFQGYGGIVGPNNPLPLEPWASSCDTQTGPGCYVAGVSGIAYLALDALINGNGEGWEDNGDWGVSAVNYFFEGGTFGAGTEYLLQESLGQANNFVSVLITLAFAGTQLVTVVYDNALQLLGDAAKSVPLVGDYLYGVINAYLGPASLNANFQGYTAGLTGILNYTIDVLQGNAPSSTTTTPASSAALTAASVAAPSTVDAVASATAEAAVAASSTRAAVESKTVSTVAEAGTESVTAADAKAETAAVDATATAETTSVTDSASAPATESGTQSATTAAAATASADGTDSATASEPAPAKATARTRNRPIRDAVDKVSKSIGSALKGDKATEKASDKSAAASSSDANSSS